MYLNRPGQPFAAGHESAGVTAPALEWFLAEGATGRVLRSVRPDREPRPQSARRHGATTCCRAAARSASSTRVAPESRFTIYVDDEQFPAGSGQRPLADTSVAMRVRSLNGVPIIVERAMWWPQPNWYEAHNAPGDHGDRARGGRWPMATTGGPNGAETYVLIANTVESAGGARRQADVSTRAWSGDSGTIDAAAAEPRQRAHRLDVPGQPRSSVRDLRARASAPTRCRSSSSGRCTRARRACCGRAGTAAVATRADALTRSPGAAISGTRW